MQNPLNLRPLSQEDLSSSRLRIALSVFLFALLFCGKPAAAQGQQPTPQIAQSATSQAVYVPSRITQAVDETKLTLLRGNVHPLARPEFDRGVAPLDLPMQRMMLVLKRSPEQETALAKLLDEQQDKSSPNYHKWLTPEQFGLQFGPSDADVQAVTLWLESQGFQVAQVAKGRTVIEFSGVAAQVQSAFHTAIHKFVVNGEEHWANVSDPQIPAALAPVVAGVASLHNFRHQPYTRFLGTFQRTKATGEVKPLFTYTDSNGQFFGVGPADFATIYNVPSTATGAGVTIAIVGRTNINIPDVHAFRSMFGLPVNDPSVVLNGPDPGIVSPGEESEADLDVEWSGAVAPLATIKLVVTETPESNASDGIDLSALYIVDNDLAPVMSESFGSCEAALLTAGNQFENNLWQQAAAEGITVTVASGDNGSAGCDNPNTETAAQFGLAVSGIASTPFNIAVGGTDFDSSLSGYPAPFWNTANTTTTPPIPSSALSYIPEVPWNDSCAAAGLLTGCATVRSSGSDLVAASGGPSNVYKKPTWQTGLSVPLDGMRDIPDVSLFASDGNHRSFYIICQSDQDPTGGSGCDLATSPTSPNHNFQAAGGTSASVQAFAGIMALVNQQTGQRQGNANPVVYALAAASGNSCTSNAAAVSNTNCVFYDVTKSNISVACHGGKPNCSNASTAASAFGVMTTATGGNTLAFGAGSGYDLATGLGSVNVANLLAKWSSVTFFSSTAAITASPSGTIPHGSNASFTVHVTSGSGTPTGNVTLIASPPGFAQEALGPFPLTSGTAAVSTDLLPGSPVAGGVPQPYPVVAHYPGDGTFGASDSAPVNVTVSKESSQTVVRFITFSANGVPIFNTGPITVAYGSPYILRVDVRNSAGVQCSTDTALPTTPPTAPCPTGTVNLTDNGSPLKDFSGGNTGTTTLNGQGYLEDQPIQLPASSTPHNIVAAYLGDNSYNASTSPALAVTVNQATTTTAVAAIPTTITSGGSVTLTALVSTPSNGDAPCDGTANTGTVRFLNGSTAISGTVTYVGTSGAASTTGAASCTATLATTLSASLMQRSDVYYASNRQKGSGWLFAASGLMLGFLILPGIPAKLRRRKSFFIVLFLALAVLSAGVVGCGGGGGGGRTIQISAQYGGDSNYSNSTAPAITITVQ